jgi:4-hydroxy-tetrahydrodipicolinate synthase
MKKTAIEQKSLGGVWSAAPTPFTKEGRIDSASIKRMTEHHCRLGINGLFLLGTNGEGPWLTDAQRSEVVRATVAAARGRLVVTAQVTDNSAARILDNIARVKRDGADIAIIAPPFFLFPATPANILALYLTVIRNSPLPIGIYDRGMNSSVQVPLDVMRQLYAEKNVILVKDSSSDPARREMALAVRKQRRSLTLLNGNEFDCAGYLKAGYDGLLLGGAVFNGHMAALILAAAKQGDHDRAERIQKRMNRIMFSVYGGKKITCWLAGEKHLLVKMGLFQTSKNLLGYSLTPSCSKAIDSVLKRDAAMLMPWLKVR